MRLLPSEREEVQGVAVKWKAQYCHDGRWSELRMRNGETSSELIYKRLLAMPTDATAKDVEEIIGTDGWVGESCTECHGKALVLIGQEPDYESSTVYLCAECVAKVAELIKVLRA